MGSVDGVQDAQDPQALRRVPTDGTVGQKGRKEKQLTPSTGRELENEGYVCENVQAVGCSGMKCLPPPPLLPLKLLFYIMYELLPTPLPSAALRFQDLARAKEIFHGVSTPFHPPPLPPQKSSASNVTVLTSIVPVCTSTTVPDVSNDGSKTILVGSSWSSAPPTQAYKKRVSSLLPKRGGGKAGRRERTDW